MATWSARRALRTDNPRGVEAARTSARSTRRSARREAPAGARTARRRATTAAAVKASTRVRREAEARVGASSAINRAGAQNAIHRPSAPAEGEHQALGEQLPGDAAAAGAEREPDGDLATAGRGAREQQIADVGARQREDQHHRDDYGPEHRRRAGLGVGSELGAGDADAAGRRRRDSGGSAGRARRRRCAPIGARRQPAATLHAARPRLEHVARPAIVGPRGVVDAIGSHTSTRSGSCR